MLRYLTLCLCFSIQSCNLGDDLTDEDTGDDASELASDGCKDYCVKVDNTCLGDHTLYPSTNACLNACALFIDRPESKGAFTGDTLQCRIYHINAASSNPSVHCPHGSAESVGKKCRDFQTVCSTYCGELSEVCAIDFEDSFAADGIATLQNCINSCPGILPKNGEPMADDTTDTVNCRLSQLTQQNCEGGKVESTVCIVPVD